MIRIDTIIIMLIPLAIVHYSISPNKRLEVICKNALLYGKINRQLIDNELMGVAHFLGFKIIAPITTVFDFAYFNGKGAIFFENKIIFNGTINCNHHGDCYLKP